ncbi:uncharacterized protein GGS22DRAFT_188678 [Annulohypoxylon maeteangense]|uniref:uncharacterized protein n=1 Tax=Annulohypoxylon maeteangense TaxID=1927788 RepID=UPI002008DB2B|nr:uncharacterized protein GGS22DRAFT_188678 [Annulohypoxylon maeteangense]KAI0885388.1 hypothetical protein GGS22DRAFT_188678 [Annulohypoxylon maeteangense]
MDSSTSTFSPERCANLHNQLLAKATEHSPDVQIEQTLSARFLDIAPEFTEVPSLDDLPLYRFLRLVNTTPPASNGGVDLLTPFTYQPDPRTFWTDRVSHEPSFVLLYGQNNGDSPIDGGIYVDILSYQAVWHSGNSPRFPPSDQWLPLEVILQKSLDAWTTGKFYWDAQEATIKVRNWTQHDVEQSIAAFHRLISSIELRMPSDENQVHSHHRLEPLDSQILEPFKISTFAVRFLSTANRPDFPFVAPGIRVFTPLLLDEIYGVEVPDSIRRTHWLGDEEDWPTLILPGVDSVPHNVDQSTNQNINAFDQNWGFGKFTVNRQSGLYIAPDTSNSDLVRLVASSGLCSACEFRSPCRWGPPRDPRLAEVFDHWTSLVEDGTWAVDANGVSTGHDWFTIHTSVAKIAPVV